MKKFLIAENTSKIESTETAEKIKEYLTGHGADAVIVPALIAREEIPKDVDVIITVGGDGTLINIASKTAGLNIPVAGIKVGHLGYLTSAGSKEEIKEMLDELINDEYSVINCISLEAEIDGTPTGCIFNELAIGREDIARVVRAQVYVDGELLNNYSADGFIVATPAGSTAYNLSAGGPVIQTDSNTVVITPICPHKSIGSSIVLSAESEIKFIIEDGATSCRPVAVHDDSKPVALHNGSVVTVRRGAYTIPLIRLKNETFISNLRKKMETI